MLDTSFSKDWPISFREDVNGRRMTHNARRTRLIAIGHISESADQKQKISIEHNF